MTEPNTGQSYTYEGPMIRYPTKVVGGKMCFPDLEKANDDVKK